MHIYDNNLCMVAQGSTIYARVAELNGALKVKWGEEGTSQCSVSYMLAPGIEDDTKQTAIQRFSNECR